jgi:hypothetical protein
MEVSGESHSSYRGMHALTTIFEEKRVLGPLDHPVLSDSHLSLSSEGPDYSLNDLERISCGDIPQKRERFELNSTEKVVVSSLLLPAKEDTVVSFSSNTERTTVVLPIG